MSPAPVKPRRVVVTGIAALSPGGVGLDAWRRWQPAGRPGPIAGCDPAAVIGNPKRLRSMHRTFQLMAAVAVLAMREAGVATPESTATAGVNLERAGIASGLPDLSPLTPDLLGVLAQVAPADGSGRIPWARFAELALHELHPFRRLTLLANMAAAHTSLLFGLQGPSFTFTSGSASGPQTIFQASWAIVHGRADFMLCQCAESPEQIFTGRPRAELAAAVVLEERAAALARGARPQAEIYAREMPGAGRHFSLAEPDTGSPTAAMLAAMARIADAGSRDGRTPSLALPELWAPEMALRQERTA